MVDLGQKKVDLSAFFYALISRKLCSQFLIKKKSDYALEILALEEYQCLKNKKRTTQ